MDLREKKTKRNIRNAFIEVRCQKALERITIKELAEKAEISKATFYLHYKDIYDLSDALQKEVIQNVLTDIKDPQIVLTNTEQFTIELFHSFHSHQNLINILFSGSQASIFPISIERELKQYIFNLLPHMENDAKFNIMLSYQILGSFYAWQENYKEFGSDSVIEIIGKMTQECTLF